MSEGVVRWDDGWTWYRIEGDLDGAEAAPLVVLHGGPGAAHDYMESVADLARTAARPCVLYDQLGCGRSQHRPDAPADFWTVELFEDPTVYQTMNGPSEFHVIGTLKSWDITPRLGAVNVPTLVISGEYDEATPAVVRPLVQALPDARWELIDDASHTPHLEQPERFLELIETFLAAHD